MRVNKPLFYSIGISVIVHILFFTCATGVKIPGAYTILIRTKRFFNIKALEKETPSKKPLRERGITYAGALKFESPIYFESIMSYIDREEKAVKKAGLTPSGEEVTEPVTVSGREEFDYLMKSEKDYDVLRKGLPRDTRKDLVEVADLESRDIFARPKDFLSEPELSRDFFEKMPGFTPKMTGGFFDSTKRKVISKFAKTYTPAIKRKTDFADLKEYLVCELSRYEDPMEGQKYYKISIRAGKDATNLPMMPKEIVFLVDCSLSIQPKRLEQFKKGLHYCLNHLDPEDHFNIMAFKEKIFWFSPHSVKPDRSNIRDALDFVDRLTAGEATDTYKALYEGIKAESIMIPSYIVLFSDGRPTYGVTNSRKIINEISRFNNGKRPVFAFSGGARVNRYFLDFISYKNRGWTEYAHRTLLIGRHIADMYEKIKDPILLNLRYRISGLDIREIVPKTLPDFFRNAEFTLFGKYTDESKFSLQFLGDLKGETSEFIVVGSLKDAPRGDKDIARNWAFNKIYYLIGLLEYGKENEKILKEINFLCNKFDIKTPYSEEIRE